MGLGRRQRRDFTKWLKKLNEFGVVYNDHSGKTKHSIWWELLIKKLDNGSRMKYEDYRVVVLNEQDKESFLKWQSAHEIDHAFEFYILTKNDVEA